jgi:hypothetical protein
VELLEVARFRYGATVAGGRLRGPKRPFKLGNVRLRDFAYPRDRQQRVSVPQDSPGPPALAAFAAVTYVAWRAGSETLPARPRARADSC